jgi:hypothetical protein
VTAAAFAEKLGEAYERQAAMLWAREQAKPVRHDPA